VLPYIDKTKGFEHIYKFVSMLLYPLPIDFGLAPHLSLYMALVYGTIDIFF